MIWEWFSEFSAIFNNFWIFPGIVFPLFPNLGRGTNHRGMCTPEDFSAGNSPASESLPRSRPCVPKLALSVPRPRAKRSYLHCLQGRNFQLKSNMKICLTHETLGCIWFEAKVFFLNKRPKFDRPLLFVRSHGARYICVWYYEMSAGQCGHNFCLEV
jgi:hypothetical protein